MTIFDTLKYPISDNHDYPGWPDNNEYQVLPDSIKLKYQQHFYIDSRMKDWNGVNELRKIIFQHNNDNL